MASRWMQHAANKMKEEGTEGSFTRIAHEHGRSVPAEAQADKNKPGKIGKKARMAIAFEGAHHHK
jgi:hypothetical protein